MERDQKIVSHMKVLEGQRRDLPRIERGTTISVRFGDQEQVCILSNSSPKGAMLHVNPDLDLPSRFLLLFNGEAIPVMLQWRSAARIGVRFDHEFLPL